MLMKTKLWPPIIVVAFILFACTRNFLKPACTESGTIGSDEVSHPTQGFDISFQYYLPPCYEKRTNIRFPVLYLITMPLEFKSEYGQQCTHVTRRSSDPG